jgi:hypothetical protein
MYKELKTTLKEVKDMGLVMLFPAVIAMVSCTQHAKAYSMFPISQAHAETYCNPERSKPCGGGCISLDKTCRKSWTTSKVGINPNQGPGKGYANPTYVKSVPGSK